MLFDIIKNKDNSFVKIQVKYDDKVVIKIKSYFDKVITVIF